MSAGSFVPLRSMVIFQLSWSSSEPRGVLDDVRDLREQLWTLVAPLTERYRASVYPSLLLRACAGLHGSAPGRLVDLGDVVDRRHPVGCCFVQPCGVGDAIDTRTCKLLVERGVIA